MRTTTARKGQMPFSRGPPEAPSTRRLKSRRPKYLINRRNRVAAFARAAAALDVFEAIVATPVRPGDLRVAARSVRLARFDRHGPAANVDRADHGAII